MTRARPLVAAGVGVTLTLAAVLSGATSAWAHDRLVLSDPAADATVTTLSAVTLTYSASLLGPEDQTANLVQVTGPDGAHYETACATVTGPVVTVPVALGPAGTYTVDWRVVSSDGHPVSDSFAFTYAPSAAATPTAGSATSACPAIAAAAPTGTGDDSAGIGLVVGLAVGGVVVVGILVAIVIVARRPRSDPEEE